MCERACVRLVICEQRRVRSRGGGCSNLGTVQGPLDEAEVTVHGWHSRVGAVTILDRSSALVDKRLWPVASIARGTSKGRVQSYNSVSIDTLQAAVVAFHPPVSTLELSRLEPVVSQ